MKSKYSAIHVGASGFPFGSAGVNKCIALYKTMLKESIDVTIINNLAIHQNDVPFHIKKNGYIEGLNYIYTTPTPYRPNSFLMKRWSATVGLLNEFFLILGKLWRKQVDIIIFYPARRPFFDLVYYRIFSRLFKVPLICHYVEYFSALDKDQRLDILLERQLFDRYVTRFVDGILPISEFLISKIKEVNFKGEILKIPPICDYREINKVQIINTSETYFLYVGYFIYKWAINFVIKSFESLADNNCYLHLVINGGSQQLADLQSEINTSIKKDKIILLSKLSYPDLISQYKNACALLIPLESRIRDLARFPQKISEYLASERPIVTTANGEIKYYFIDGENALISQSEDIVEFSSKMEIAINQPELAKEIGRKGYDTGLKYFDIDSYRNSLREFVANLCNKKSKK